MALLAWWWFANSPVVTWAHHGLHHHLCPSGGINLGEFGHPRVVISLASHVASGHDLEPLGSRPSLAYKSSHSHKPHPVVSGVVLSSRQAVFG